MLQLGQQRGDVRAVLHGQQCGRLAVTEQLTDQGEQVPGQAVGRVRAQRAVENSAMGRRHAGHACQQDVRGHPCPNGGRDRPSAHLGLGGVEAALDVRRVPGDDGELEGQPAAVRVQPEELVEERPQLGSAREAAGSAAQHSLALGVRQPIDLSQESRRGSHETHCARVPS